MNVGYPPLRAVRGNRSQAIRDRRVTTQSRRWVSGRVFGFDGRESYRELRLEPLCCPHRLSLGTAPYERENPRRKDRF